MLPKLNPTARRTATAVFYLLLLCADVFLTNWDAIFGPNNCNDVALTTRMWYQRVVTLGYRKPKPHFVRLITVTPSNITGPCDYRELLSQVLAKVSALQPAVVVLDYSFSPHDCGTKTDDLQKAMNDLARTTPVIYGQKSYTLEELRKDPRLSADLNLLADRKLGFGEDDQAIWPSDIVPDASKPMMMALYRLDCDTRRIPLEWPVFEKRGAIWAKARTPMPTIAFAAASRYDDSLLALPARFPTENPFTSFIPKERFEAVDSTALASLNDEQRSRFHHHIVILGDTISDLRQSVLGELPGVFLQANYIESLLDDRYFRGLGPFSTGLTTFVCLFIIAFIFERSDKAGAALLFSVSFWLILSLVSYIALVYFAVLFTFWVPVIPAIALGFIAKLHSR